MPGPVAVSDLLDLSLADGLAITQQPISLSAIVGDAIETVRTEAEAKNISPVVPKSLVVDGDRCGSVRSFGTC